MSIAGILGLVFLGMILLFVEIIVIPGVGLVGVAGLGLLVWAVADIWGTYGALYGVISLLLSGTVVLFGFLKLAGSDLGRKMILDDQLDEEPDSSTNLIPLVGKSGVSRSPMRPGGVIEIDGERFDAVAIAGQWIEAGTPIAIVEVQTNNLFVKTINESSVAPKETQLDAEES